MNPASEYPEQIKAEMGPLWLPQLYSQRVLKFRTRAYQFPALPKTGEPEIHHTLLGVELKCGRRRMLCPDLATARYLAVFARVGCRAIAIPYDITRISLVADELESSWHRMLLIADRLTGERKSNFRTRIQRQIIGKVRDELNDLGAGPRIPEFKEITKQRTLQRRELSGRMRD